ncbi:unnamed protein product [Callosobruchus maculatus]|uniref:ALMS motif domain-containing protein n=1 Tax=Callosobruchus maculatus TaxID=64391 RepID=A0A653BVJ1_CALMS|nr:unnamed protein product [Callosobruchus maculatus]
MASGSKDDDAISKHVLDYYQRYSRNRHLPKYFTGASVSYLPEIRGESDSEYPPHGNPLIVVTCEEKGDTSGASSVLSNKKLEWDNGADIGYENCEGTGLKRSSSLPAVLDIVTSPHASFATGLSCSSGSELKIVILDSSSENNVAAPKPESSTSSSLHEDEKKLLSSSSSSSSAHPEKKVQHSSGSSSSRKDEKPAPGTSSHTSSSGRNIRDFMNTLSFLKQKIGVPDAHSTPHEDAERKNVQHYYSETPVLSTAQKPVRRLTEVNVLKNDESQDTKTVMRPNQKVITLCFTKPISVECVGEPKPEREKDIGVIHSNIGIQTDEISEKELIKIISRSQSCLNQSVLFYKHADNKNESSSQTDSDQLGSNCDSFEYIRGRNVTPRSKSSTENIQAEITKKSPRSKCSRDRDVECERVHVEVKKSAGQHQIETLNASSDSQCSENGIGNEEVEKSIHLIQKLIKSKKYDPTTKKRYIKKLIKKISESKFMEESSTSSELFFPKKSGIPKKPQHNTPSTETSSEPPQEASLHPTDYSWLPANKPHTLSPRKSPCEAGLKSSPKKKDSETKMYAKVIKEDLKLQTKKKLSKANVCHQDVHAIHNLSSPTDIIPVDARDMRKNLFTLTNNEFSVNRETESSKTKSSDNVSMEKHYESASSQKSYRDWKDDKTNSEKGFEDIRFVGDGDYLTNWASKERAYQINWINDEICHLGKLKNLLESQPGEAGTSSGSRSTGSQRITSVYQVSRESCIRGEKQPKKYVIETQFDPKDGEPKSYMLDGKRYFVEEGNMASRPRQVLGDIEVSSSDTTMNIKVTAFCETCKRSPCVCAVKSKHRASTSETSRQHVYSSEICISCHTTPCICKKSTGAIPKKCTECNLYPCGCVVCKDSYFGQFIPAKRPGTSKAPQEIHAPKKACANSGETSERYNSLKRVFENCSCTSTKCTCDFVDKLLKHFDVGRDQDLNKHVCTCKDQKVQAQSEMKSEELQTRIIGEDKDIQTYKKVHFANGKPLCDVASQQSEDDIRQFDSKINQTNRRELGDKDEETATDRVGVLETVTQTNGIQNISRETQSEQTKTIGIKTQTDSSVFNLKDKAINTLPRAKHYHTGSQSEAADKTLVSTGTDSSLKPEYVDADSQYDKRKIVDTETLVYAPESVSYELIMVEPEPLYAPPVLKEIQDEAVNTTPRPEIHHKSTQFEAKETLQRVMTNVRDTGVNSNDVPGVKASVSYQFPETRQTGKNQCISTIHDVSVRGIQTKRMEREFQTQTEIVPVTNEEQDTCSFQHVAQTQTKDTTESADKGTQSTHYGQRAVKAVQVPQNHEQIVQAMISKENTLKNTRAVQARKEKEDGTQVQVLQDFSTNSTQAVHSEPRITQAIQTPQVHEHGAQIRKSQDSSAKGTQATYRDQRDVQAVQAPQVQDGGVQVRSRQDSSTKSTQATLQQELLGVPQTPQGTQTMAAPPSRYRDKQHGESQTTSHLQFPESRDAVPKTQQTDIGHQYVHTQTQNILDPVAKATQPTESYQQDAYIQTVGIMDPANKVIQAEKYESVSQIQTEGLRDSSTIGVQPTQDLQRVGQTQTASIRGPASKIVQAYQPGTICQTQTEVPTMSLTTDAQNFQKVSQTQTRGVDESVDEQIKDTREYQKAKQTQTSEDRQTSPKEVYTGQKSVDTHTRSKGGLVKEIQVTTYTDAKIQAHTYPRSTAGKKIKFVGSDSEMNRLRSNLKNVACMCACRDEKPLETSSEGSEQALRRVKTVKNKKTETDKEKGRVHIVEDRRSEPELIGRRPVTLKNRSVETDKQRSTVGTCRCGFTDRVYLKDEAVQIRKKDTPEEVSYRNFSASSNGTTESTTITSTPPSYTVPPSLLTCICCDRRTTSDNVSVFTNNSREYFLCCSCVKKRPILTSICYTGPDRQSLLTSTAGPSSTFTRTESVEEFCTCIKPYRPKNSDYCSHCRNRLRKTTRNKGGIAYTLTLECDSSDRFKVKKRRKKPLEEIRVKIPCPYNRKKYKDRENLQRKSSHIKGGLSSDKNDSGDTNKSADTNSNNNTESRSTNGTYKIDSSTADSKEDKPKRPSTLQEYLKLNRPDFIDSAEFRRNVVNNSKVDRIKNKDEIKLRFFEENMNTTDPNIKTRLFSEREMKEITKRNYKKLPEVQLRAVHNKELKLKTADRFIKDMLAKKIQGSVLKGRRNFPIDRHVINLKK